MRSWMWAAALCGLLLTGGRPALAARVTAAKVAAVIISPAGATLRPGDPLQCSAIAVDKKGHVIDGLTIRWSSSRSAVVAVDQTGSAHTGGTLGAAKIFARTGGKTGSISVSVVAATNNGATLASGLSAVRDIATDDTSVYWTENSKKRVRLRKISKDGGPIIDLASLPLRDARELKYTFFHIRPLGDTVYWSRLVQGFARHWAILSVPKTGGPTKTIVPDDASVNLDLATGWQVVGQYVVVSFSTPTVVKLGKNTRVGAYNTLNGVWTSLIDSKFNAGQVIVDAADGTSVFARAFTQQGSTVTLKIDPAGLENSFVTLAQQNRQDTDLALPAAVDGEAVYYWTQSGQNGHILARAPLDGTAATALLSGFFGLGLNTDGGKVYWVRSTGALVSLPNTGNVQPTQVLSGVYPTASIRGVQLDAGSFFLVRKKGKTYQIFRADRGGQ